MTANSHRLDSIGREECIILVENSTHLKVGGAVAALFATLLAASFPVASAFAQTVPTITLTASPARVAQQDGANVTYTATSTGITDPRYSFWVEGPNGQWKSAQNYSPADTFTFANIQSGNYLIAAYVLSAANLAAGRYSAAIHPLSDGMFVGSKVTVKTSTNSLVKGQTAAVRAESTGIYSPQYQFWYKDPSGAWHQDSAGFTASPSFTFIPAMSGPYEILAYAKSPDAVNSQEGALCSNNLSETVGFAQPLVLSAPQNISAFGSGSGVLVTWKAPATGTAAGYQIWAIPVINGIPDLRAAVQFGAARASASSYKVSGLTAGESYEFNVDAVGETGNVVKGTPTSVIKYGS